MNQIETLAVSLVAITNIGMLILFLRFWRERVTINIDTLENHMEGVVAWLEKSVDLKAVDEIHQSQRLIFDRLSSTARRERGLKQLMITQQAINLAELRALESGLAIIQDIQTKATKQIKKHFDEQGGEVASYYVTERGNLDDHLDRISHDLQQLKTRMADEKKSDQMSKHHLRDLKRKGGK